MFCELLNPIYFFNLLKICTKNKSSVVRDQQECLNSFLLSHPREQDAGVETLPL